jgi:hypothetical protein
MTMILPSEVLQHARRQERILVPGRTATPIAGIVPQDAHGVAAVQEPDGEPPQSFEVGVVDDLAGDAAGAPGRIGSCRRFQNKNPIGKSRAVIGLWPELV